MSQPHLPLFGILASLDVAERNAAALTLIKSLAVLQNSHKCDIDPSVEDITEEKLDQLCHPEVVYALKRLIRGLPSDREAARQGFSLALTEVHTVTVPYCCIVFMGPQLNDRSNQSHSY